jgi:hypothetical protein
MSREDLEHGGGNETGEPVAVDHEDDDWSLGVVCGVEPTMLVRFAWSSWPGVASPAPKLSKVESWPPRETAHSSPLRHRRVYKCRQQSKVLAPVAQENGPLETRAAYKDVVGRSGVNWRGENERRRESSHKSRFPSHTTITPATTRGLPVPRRGRRVSPSRDIPEHWSSPQPMKTRLSRSGRVAFYFGCASNTIK